MRLAFAAAAGTLVSCPVRAAIVHVRPDGNDALSGADWATALRTVSAGLARARDGDQVWVARGVYLGSLEMKAGVGLFGGFQGDETSLDERDYANRVTVLDGQTNGVVLVIRDGGTNTVVDGFTIRNGLGSGVVCFNTAAVVRHNVIRGSTYSANQAIGGGVFVKNLGSHAVPTIEDNVIVDNEAQDGGGIGCVDASPRIARNLIAWNHAIRSGGGISCWRDSSPLISHNTIVANTTYDLGGYDLFGGGVFATADDLDGRPHPTAVSRPVIFNNVVIGNGAPAGGGIALLDSNGGVPIVLNNTVVANSGSGVLWGSSALPGVSLAPVIRNNLVAFNPLGLQMLAGTPTNATIDHNCVFANRYRDADENYVGLPGQSGLNGNFAADPRLAQPTLGDVHLQPGSPCIDAGHITPVDADMLDVDAQPRVQGASIDIGADESDGTAWDLPVPVWHVRTDGDDQATGESWSSAKRTIQAAIQTARYRGGEVWVAEGIYPGHLWIPAFVHVYGGFSAQETRRDDRNPQTHPTVLDGAGERHIVVSTHGGYRVSAIDGFTIRNAGKYTGGVGTKYGSGGLGGGVFVVASSPRIAHNRITRNSLAFDNTPVFPQPPSYGAGIYCELSYALITGNTIDENEVLNDFDGSGGAIFCDRSWPAIEGNVLRDNHATYGAAIYCLRSTPLIRGNLIESNAMYNTYPLPLYLGSQQGAVTLASPIDFIIDANTVRGNRAAVGAGITISAALTGRIQNNLIVSNAAASATSGGGMGGGISCMVITGGVDRVFIVNNTFIHNTATQLFSEQGGGLAVSLVPSSDRAVIANNLIASNSSGIYLVPITPPATPLLFNNLSHNLGANYLGLTAGATDIQAAPRFRDPAQGDYTLAAGSPGLDAAANAYAPASDILGTPRPLDSDNDHQVAPDIGAFEAIHPQADSDADGLPDDWEIRHQLDPTTAADADLDRDGDGATNRAECLAGTDPSDATSVLRLEWITRVTGTAELRWRSVTGHAYRLEAAVALGPTALWETRAGPWTGTGDWLTYGVTVQPGAGLYFRLQVAPE